METKVMIAIIAGTASLLVAITSLVATFITSRVTARTAETIESLKQSFSATTKRVEFADGELTVTLNILMDALQAIQKMKDEILLILNAFSDSLDADEALSRITLARDGVFSGYEAGHGCLSPVEMRAYHSAKNIALYTEKSLRSDLETKEYASQLSSSTRNEITEFRNRLTDYQQVLRDSRTDRIVNRTMGVDAV